MCDNGTEMSEERLIELEIKVAYQEDLLQTLNTIVSEQQQKIAQLEASSQLLYQRQQTLAENIDGHQQDNQPPPHY